jgi:cysteine desulfurase/selenocysteine lyase
MREGWVRDERLRDVRPSNFVLGISKTSSPPWWPTLHPSFSSLQATAADPSTTSTSLPTLADAVRPAFPCLDQTIHGRPLIYLDSGATSQKPQVVLDAMDSYYRHDNANVHRGVHVLASRATASYEGGRAKLAAFIGAGSPAEVVLTRGATEAINLVAASWGGAHLTAGDIILVSVAEHHANLVPWQLIAAKTGAKVVGVPLTADKTQIDSQALHALLKEHAGRVKVVALVHMSNVLGSVLPNTAELGEAVRKAGAVLLLDACQSVPSCPVDVASLGADFLVASAHKMAGPTGIGFLWGRPDLLAAMPPFMGGGEMIERVEVETSTFAPPPARFEPGTPPIAEAVGLGAAVDFLSGLGMARVAAWEAELGGVLWDEVRMREGDRDGMGLGDGRESSR